MKVVLTWSSLFPENGSIVITDEGPRNIRIVNSQFLRDGISKFNKSTFHVHLNFFAKQFGSALRFTLYLKLNTKQLRYDPFEIKPSLFNSSLISTLLLLILMTVIGASCIRCFFNVIINGYLQVLEKFILEQDIVALLFIGWAVLCYIHYNYVGVNLGCTEKLLNPSLSI